MRVPGKEKNEEAHRAHRGDKDRCYETTRKLVMDGRRKAMRQSLMIAADSDDRVISVGRFEGVFEIKR